MIQVRPLLTETLAIGVENDRWKISDLELLSEEREIVSEGKL
jgi:hypothetical protein